MLDTNELQKTIAVKTIEDLLEILNHYDFSSALSNAIRDMKNQDIYSNNAFLENLDEYKNLKNILAKYQD